MKNKFSYKYYYKSKNRYFGETFRFPKRKKYHILNVNTISYIYT